MGFVSELGGIIDKYKPWETVYEYQQGLLYRRGSVIEAKIKHTKDELEEIEDKIFFQKL